MFKLALCQIKGSFDKITIKMITDQAGVIRPTFYNYFQDKYEVMEWRTGHFSAGDVELSVFQRLFQRVRRSGRRPYGEVPVGSGCKA